MARLVITLYRNGDEKPYGIIRRIYFYIENILKDIWRKLW